jgi:peptidoglycan-N-acetylglucosamine deacetylase
MLIDNPVPWPNGARCAVCFSFDVDADVGVHLSYPQDAHNHVHTLSLSRFGPQVGVPRLVRLFDKHQVPATFFTPGWVIERYPETVQTILHSDHELAHHGYLHHNPVGLSEAEEEDAIGRSVDIIKRVSGKKPRGYRAPSWGVSRHTMRLLAEHGVAYDSSMFGDDNPYVIAEGNRSIIELPTAHGMDDWPHYMNWRDYNYMMPISAPARAMEVFRGEFDVAWEHGALWVSVWHPKVSGRLSRAHAIDGLVTHMKNKGRVWFARLEDVAAHLQKCIDDGSWTPRVDRMPYYEGRIPELQASGKPVMLAKKKGRAPARKRAKR